MFPTNLKPFLSTPEVTASDVEHRGGGHRKRSVTPLIFLVGASWILSGCSSGGSGDAEATTTVAVETTVEQSTTTAPATTTTTTTSPEPVSSCSGTEDDLATTIGEPLGFFVCDGDWASYMTEEYAATCENCESISIAKWSNGAWEEVGNFNQYNSLSPADLDGAISKESLCAIWSTNRSSQFIGKTGCTPDS